MAGGRKAEDGGRGQEGEILRLFVRAASRTTMRENRALRSVMSDVSDEMQSKNLHSGGVWGVIGRKRVGKKKTNLQTCYLHVASWIGYE